MRAWRVALGLMLVAGTAVWAQGRGGGQGQPPLDLPADTEQITALKTEVAEEVDRLKDFSQQMVDQLFSYGELGFQEFETSAYLIGVLKEHGFTVEEGVAGIPTAFMATWGNGKPVIALGSDIDGIPQSSQKPGVAYHDPLVEGAPGHGEGLLVRPSTSPRPSCSRRSWNATIFRERFVSGRAWPRNSLAPKPTSCARASSMTSTSRSSHM